MSIFVWGIKSIDNIVESEASDRTLNDLEIRFNPKDKKFLINLDNAFIPDNPKAYYNFLLRQFTEWMQENRYYMNAMLNEKDSIENEFNSLEELYSSFKHYVENEKYK